MSQISNTPRRPSTAHSTLPRMPYEAGEALLWERQNHRMHTHLSLQMKDLQSQHAAYDARIHTAEAVAEAAEAAVDKIKLMETKIAAMEADDKDRPFDAWAKQAISGLQIFVDGQKGVRQKMSALEMKMDGLGEEVEELRDTRGLVKSLVRRLEGFEREKEVADRRMGFLESQMGRLRASEVQMVQDDNPLHVFYGIDTHRRQQGYDLEGDEEILPRQTTALPVQQPEHITNTPADHGERQPLDEDVAMPEARSDSVNAPEVEFAFENTQQFKDMQKELETLRAMCRTQEPNSNSYTADATQRPQETIVISGGPYPGFSDATTEAEGDAGDRGLGADMQLPSSPPKRLDTQSARRNLMKRPSIYEPRLPSVTNRRQPGRSALDVRDRPSLLIKLPVETQTANNRGPAKRKREEAATQRVTRRKLTVDRTAVDVPVAAVQRLEEVLTLPPSNTYTSPISPTRSKQKPGANTSDDDSPSIKLPAEAKTAPVVEVKRKTVKPKAVKAAQPSKSKPAATVKRETKAGRQPPGACKTCRARHQKCDRVLPVCGRCTKLGISCEFNHASEQAVPNVSSESSPRKKKVVPPATEDAGRERSVSVSPEAQAPQTSAKRLPALPSKKSVATAASTRASRTKKAPTKASAAKQK